MTRQKEPLESRLSGEGTAALAQGPPTFAALGTPANKDCPALPRVTASIGLGGEGDLDICTPNKCPVVGVRTTLEEKNSRKGRWACQLFLSPASPPPGGPSSLLSRRQPSLRLSSQSKGLQRETSAGRRPCPSEGEWG